jgi:hypothetical protein
LWCADRSGERQEGEQQLASHPPDQTVAASSRSDDVVLRSYSSELLPAECDYQCCSISQSAIQQVQTIPMTASVVPKASAS